MPLHRECFETLVYAVEANVSQSLLQAPFPSRTYLNGLIWGERRVGWSGMQWFMVYLMDWMDWMVEWRGPQMMVLVLDIQRNKRRAKKQTNKKITNLFTYPPTHTTIHTHGRSSSTSQCSLYTLIELEVWTVVAVNTIASEKKQKQRKHHGCWLMLLLVVGCFGLRLVAYGISCWRIVRPNFPWITIRNEKNSDLYWLFMT